MAVGEPRAAVQAAAAVATASHRLSSAMTRLPIQITMTQTMQTAVPVACLPAASARFSSAPLPPAVRAVVAAVRSRSTTTSGTVSGSLLAATAMAMSMAIVIAAAATAHGSCNRLEADCAQYSWVSGNTRRCEHSARHTLPALLLSAVTQVFFPPRLTEPVQPVKLHILHTLLLPLLLLLPRLRSVVLQVYRALPVLPQCKLPQAQSRRRCHYLPRRPSLQSRKRTRTSDFPQMARMMTKLLPQSSQLLSLQGTPVTLLVATMVARMRMRMRMRELDVVMLQLKLRLKLMLMPTLKLRLMRSARR